MRGWLAAALLALPLFATAVPAKRDSDAAILATKAAMDAFFALDGAIPRPVEPGEPDTSSGDTSDHEELIETLAACLAQGARLDRYRWSGTLLHHSLRAGFGDVTRWLLAHGADPLQKIQPGEGDLDALGVAVRVQRWAEVRLLLKQPAYRRMPADELGQRLWAGAVTDELRQALLRQKLGLPKPVAQAPAALDAALRARDTAAVERLLAGRTGRVALEAFITANRSPAAEVWPLQRWRELDARLERPVLPWALARARTEAEARALLSAGLRAPWSDARFAADVARLLPASALPGLLLDPPRGVDAGALWGPVSQQRGGDLRQMPMDAWQAYVRAAPSPDVVVSALDLVADSRWRERARQPGAAPAEAEAWQARWAPVVERLKSLPAPRRRELWSHPQFRLDAKMRELPPAFLPDFIAWAAADDALPEALPLFIDNLRPQDYEAFWAPLRQQATALADELLPALLSRLWVDPPRSRLADRMTGWSAGSVSLARWLLPRSPRLVPRRLRAGLAGADAGWSDADLVRWALAEGLALRAEVVKATVAGQAPAGPAAVRLVEAPPDCIVAPSPGLRRALAEITLTEPSQWLYDADKAGWLQAMASPRQAQCQWLRSREVVTGGSWSDESFFDGYATHMARSTIEQALHLDRWDEAAQRFVELPSLSFTARLVEVELLPRGERFWLGLASDSNGPRRAGGYALGWQDGTPSFEALEASSTLDNDWRALIDPDKNDPFGVTWEDDHQAGPREPVPLMRFVDAHLADDKQRFLAAFAALDRDALSAQRRAGVFAAWLNEGVRALSSNAQLPLEPRRRRMAWLLAVPAYADALTDDTLTALRDWLPAEDWGPMLAQRRCSKHSVFAGGSDEVRQPSEWVSKASPALSRRIEVALARDCDGEVR